MGLVLRLLHATAAQSICGLIFIAAVRMCGARSLLLLPDAQGLRLSPRVLRRLINPSHGHGRLHATHGHVASVHAASQPRVPFDPHASTDSRPRMVARVLGRERGPAPSGRIKADKSGG